jgi:predicted HicB family RNase H-like nuclease
MTRAEGYTNFTFRFDDALREKAERLAKADKRSLGVWISLLVEEKIAELEPPPTPRKRGK